MTQHCIHCYISGNVQGVWFRNSTREQAERFGITGWVRNLNDGRVEVIACGDSKSLEPFYAWLQQGPPLASVEECIQQEAPWQEYRGFSVR